MRMKADGVRKLLSVSLVALALLVVSDGIAAAQGAGTTFAGCRQAAYTNYYGCLSNASGYWAEAACYWAGAADLAQCDTKFATSFF